jgi:hypothetical protein
MAEKFIGKVEILANTSATSPTITLDGEKGDLSASNQLQAKTLAANQLVLDGADNNVLFTHSKTRTYTIGIDGDKSLMSFTNSQSRKYTITLDGEKGNLWASNQLQTKTLAANQLVLDGADNNVLFTHSKTRTYTIGIDGDKSLMSFTNSQSRNYTIWMDGEKGDISLSNADCAEDFDVSEIEATEPGTVMVIGESGKLCLSTQAYDKKVAGVISGAGNYKPGMVLDRHPGLKDRMPVALMGKVYCKVDAQYGAIEVGDLLTTSSTPGYAMKATDAAKISGTVIGKALHPLEAGQELIPILISLQ